MGFAMSRLVVRFLMLFLRVVKTPCTADCRCGGHEVLDVGPLGWWCFAIFMTVTVVVMAAGCSGRLMPTGHEVPQPKYGMTLCYSIDEWVPAHPQRLMPCPPGGPPPFILVPDPIAVAEAKR